MTQITDGYAYALTAGVVLLNWTTYYIGYQMGQMRALEKLRGWRSGK